MPESTYPRPSNLALSQSRLHDIISRMLRRDFTYCVPILLDCSPELSQSFNDLLSAIDHAHSKDSLLIVLSFKHLHEQLNIALILLRDY